MLRPALDQGPWPAHRRDPTGETTLAWTVAQDLMAFYQLTDLNQARTRTSELITRLGECPIPEIAKRGRTLHSRRTKLLAHFNHPDMSNEPTEKPQPQNQKH